MKLRTVIEVIILLKVAESFNPKSIITVKRIIRNADNTFISYKSYTIFHIQ